MASKPAQVYAFYDGGQLVAVGTADQLAKILGKPKQTIYWYASAQARRKRAVPIDMPEAIDMFAKTNNELMCMACANICGLTGGRCRDSAAGCDWLGWCEPAYRAACRMREERSNGGKQES